MAHLVRQERDRKRRPVHGEGPATLVHDHAPRRGDGRDPHAVFLGEAQEVIALDDLDLPEPDDEDAEEGGDHRHERGEPSFKHLGVSIFHSCRDLS
jgi:hypothetical protein